MNNKIHSVGDLFELSQDRWLDDLLTVVPAGTICVVLNDVFADAPNEDLRASYFDVQPKWTYFFGGGKKFSMRTTNIVINVQKISN